MNNEVTPLTYFSCFICLLSLVLVIIGSIGHGDYCESKKAPNYLITIGILTMLIASGLMSGMANMFDNPNEDICANMLVPITHFMCNLVWAYFIYPWDNQHNTCSLFIYTIAFTTLTIFLIVDFISLCYVALCMYYTQRSLVVDFSLDSDDIDDIFEV